MNALEYIPQCRSLGEKAAEASHHHDASGARWFHDQAQRVFRMFRGEDRRALEGAYTLGYTVTTENYGANYRR